MRPLDKNSSIIGRLLEEVSWEGANVRGYRQGGRGRENVLTAEVLGPLCSLPRQAFLGEVLRSAHGADVARAVVADQVEEARITLLPEQSWLAPGGTVVQPDGLIETPDTKVLIEAKGMRRSRFQPEQLAREFCCVTRDAAAAPSPTHPLLLLLLPQPPPVPVAGLGRVPIHTSIKNNLAHVAARTANLTFSTEDLTDRIDATVSWITWHEIRDTISSPLDAHPDLRGLPRTVQAAVQRLRDDAIRAVEWHGT